MGYETAMQKDILGLLGLFSGRVPDPETHGWVLRLASDRDTWPQAHKVFNKVRQRTLTAIDAKDSRRECQYMFEEVCLQSLYNETNAVDPFDFCSPYWVIKNALCLAQALGIATDEVVAVVAPLRDNSPDTH
jgi:hypothetical protein